MGILVVLKDADLKKEDSLPRSSGLRISDWDLWRNFVRQFIPICIPIGKIDTFRNWKITNQGNITEEIWVGGRG